jgi:hypothetical protein
VFKPTLPAKMMETCALLSNVPQPKVVALPLPRFVMMDKENAQPRLAHLPLVSALLPM